VELKTCKTFNTKNTIYLIIATKEKKPEMKQKGKRSPRNCELKKEENL
jgi:hypothetical protein